MKEVTVLQLKEMIDNGEDYQLIDVREQHEYDFANLKGELIPQAFVMDNLDKISKDKKVVVHCRSGARSAQIISLLEMHTDHKNLYNLVGGILAWSNEIDPSIPQY